MNKIIRTGRPPIYPWAKWIGAKGTRRRLRRGKDFDCQPHSFSIQIRQAASRLGYLVSVFISEDERGRVIVTLTNRGKP